MKVGFNALGGSVGLGNNGGSRTIILCNQTLNDLGHESIIISKLNHFNWFPYKKSILSIPKNLDVLISIDWRNVNLTLESDAKIKAWYARSFQKQAYFGALDGVKFIVNSEGLKKRYQKIGATNCHVIYQGIDFDWWKNYNSRSSEKIRIGCLYNRQPQKNWTEFEELAKRLDPDKYEFVAFGSSNCKRGRFLTQFLINPSRKHLVTLYNSCHIWFAPTKSEGLHNVPMEAAMCGCLVMCGDYEGNGMLLDYAFDDETAMVYSDLEDAVLKIENPNWDVIDNMQDCLRMKIGTRSDNMNKLLEVLTNE